MSYYETLSYNGHNLAEIENIKITEVGLDTTPEMIVRRGKLFLNEGEKVFQREYGARKIPVNGIITASDRESYLNTRAELMRKLDDIEKDLLVIIQNTELEFTATPNNIIFKDSGGGYAQFSIEFICSDPFARARDAITILDNEAYTTGSETITISAIEGSYGAPIYIMLNLLAVTGGDSAYIQISNQKGDLIKITRDWSAYDQVIIDTREKVCTVNGVAVDYTGYFWRLNPLDTQITYTDSFTTRNTTILATYKPTFL